MASSLDRTHEIDRLMRRLPVEFAFRWCEGGMCACLGCANVTGDLTRNGYTKAEWQAWKEWKCAVP